MENFTIAVREPITGDNTVRPTNELVTEAPAYVADNGTTRAEFYQTGNRVVFEAYNRRVTYTPQSIKYVAGLVKDTIYTVQDAPIHVNGPNVRIDRSFPDIDDQFAMEGDRLKHSVIVQNFQRAPRSFIRGNVDFVVGGRLEFDTDLAVLAHGERLIGAFETPDAIDLIDEDGHVVFSLPPVVAYDSAYPQRAETAGKYRVTQNEAGVLMFDVVVDNAWMASEDRRYPVVIDPTVIVSAAYDTAMNGGQKGVHLANGWFVQMAYYSTSSIIYLYVSKDNGSTFSQLCWISGAKAYPAMMTDGTKVFVFHADPSYYIRRVDIDPTTVTNADQTNNTSYILVGGNGGITAVSGISAAIDGNGIHHVAACLKGATGTSLWYNKTTNTTASTWLNSGGGMWITNTTVTTQNYTNPCLVLDSTNWPYIAVQYDDTTVAPNTRQIQTWYFDNTATWRQGPVAEGSTYVQQTPALAVDSFDMKWLVWAGKDATDSTYFNIRYATFSTPTLYTLTATKLTSGNTYSQVAPTITIDKADNVYVLWQGRASGSYDQIRRNIYTRSSQTWDTIATLTSSTVGCSNPVALWSKYNMSLTDKISWTYKDGSTIKFDFVTVDQQPYTSTPTPRTNFDAALGAGLQWQFNDPDPTDSQTAYAVQVWEAGKVGLGSAPVDTGKIGSASSYYTISPYKLANGKTYQWRVRVWDKSDLASDWTTYGTFKCSATPIVTCNAPQTVTSDSFTFTGTYIQAAGVAQRDFQFKIWDAAGLKVILDSGVLTGTSNKYTFRGLANNTSYQVEFITSSQDGIVGTSGKQAFSVSYTPCATPIVVIMADNNHALVSLSWSHPTPVGTQPAVAYSEVYRRKLGDSTWTMLATQLTGTTYTDYMAPNGNYEYAVRAFSSYGAVSAYAIQAVTIAFVGDWLYDTSTGNQFQFLYNRTAYSMETLQERQQFQTFASKFTVRYGPLNSKKGTLDALMIKGTQTPIQQLQALEASIANHPIYYLKTAAGEVLKVDVYAPKRNMPVEYLNSQAIGISVEWVEVS